MPGDLQGRSRHADLDLDDDDNDDDDDDDDDDDEDDDDDDDDDEWLADFNISWWYEDILHVRSHINIEFKGAADFNTSW